MNAGWEKVFEGEGLAPYFTPAREGVRCGPKGRGYQHESKRGFP